MASRKDNNITATNLEDSGARSSIFQLISDHKIEDSNFHIRIPHSPSVPYLTFRNYKSVAEAEEAAIQAGLFVETLEQKIKAHPELEQFKDMDKATLKSAWLVGFLSVDFNPYEFFLIAKETPMLFMHIRIAVNEACYGNEAVLWKAEMDEAKKE